MNVLWSRPRATAGDVVDALEGPRKPAYNSVLTILRILERKGYVTHEKGGRAFTWLPAIGRADARRGALSHLLSRFFDGFRRAPRAQPARRRRAGSRGRAARARADWPEPGGGAVTGLVAWTWQGLALAIAASLVLRVCRGLDAASRHALWWGVLATILALPWLQGLPAFVAPATPPGGAPGASTALDSLPALVVPTPPDWLIAVAIGAWLGTVMLGLLRIALACAFAARVHRTARPLEAHRAERLRLWTAAGPPRRRMALLVSAHVRTACALGWWRPAIVVPPGLLEALDDEELDQIVMHERAHLERADDVWRFVEAVVECVAGLHPAVRLALHHIDLEREAACDNRVVLATGRSDRYAACLADVAATLCAARLTPSLIPGAVRGASALGARVERLLDRSRARRARGTAARGCHGLRGARRGRGGRVPGRSRGRVRTAGRSSRACAGATAHERGIISRPLAARSGSARGPRRGGLGQAGGVRTCTPGRTDVFRGPGIGCPAPARACGDFCGACARADSNAAGIAFARFDDPRTGRTDGAPVQPPARRRRDAVVRGGGRGRGHRQRRRTERRRGWYRCQEGRNSGRRVLRPNRPGNRQQFLDAGFTACQSQGRGPAVSGRRGRTARGV